MTRTEKAVRAIIDRVEKNGQAYYIDRNHKTFIIGSLLIKQGYYLISSDGTDKVIVKKQKGRA